MLELLIAHPILFLMVFVAGGITGAFALRRNPLKGAATLEELESFYKKEKQKLLSKL